MSLCIALLIQAPIIAFYEYKKNGAWWNNALDWSSGLIGVCLAVYLTIWASADQHQETGFKTLQAIRSLDIRNGLSPAVPAIFLVAAASILARHGLAAQNKRYSHRLPPPLDALRGLSFDDKLLRLADSPIQRSYLPPASRKPAKQIVWNRVQRWHGAWFLSMVIALGLVITTFERPVEGVAFQWVFIPTIILTCVAHFYLLFKFRALWTELRGYLERLAELPMAPAWRRLPANFAHMVSFPGALRPRLTQLTMLVDLRPGLLTEDRRREFRHQFESEMTADPNPPRDPEAARKLGSTKMGQAATSLGQAETALESSAISEGINGATALTKMETSIKLALTNINDAATSLGEAETALKLGKPRIEAAPTPLSESITVYDLASTCRETARDLDIHGWPKQKQEFAYSFDAAVKASERWEKPDEAKRFSAQEDFVAACVTTYLSQFFVYSRSLLGALVATPILLWLALASYTFQPQRLLVLYVMVLMLITIVVVSQQFFKLNREPVISALTGTTPNRLTWDANLVWAVLLHVVPLAAVVLIELANAWSMFLAWIDPLLRILR